MTISVKLLILTKVNDKFELSCLFKDTNTYNLHFTASNGMFAYHNIRLQIGIGGILFAKAMPEHFDQLQWKCPALIVDYVRVFKKIIKKDVNIDQFSKCNNIEKHTDESDIIQNICTQSMNLMKNKNNFFVSKDINWGNLKLYSQNFITKNLFYFLKIFSADRHNCSTCTFFYSFNLFNLSSC